MKTVNKPSDNVGGLIKIWAVPPSDIQISGNQVTFTSTDNIYSMYVTPGTLSFSEPSSREDAGLLYSPSLKGVIPKDSPETSALLTEMEARARFVVIYLDNNEYYKVVGTPKQSLRFASSLGTGSDMPDRNQFDISFNGKTTSRAVFIDNPFV